MIKSLTVVLFFALQFASQPLLAREVRLCQGLFIDDGRVQMVYPGVLAQLQDGTKSLAYSGLSLGIGHRFVIKKLKSLFTGANSIKQILWMGELEFQAGAGGIDYLVSANEVSGYYAESIRSPRTERFDFKNDVGALKDYLLAPKLDASLGRTRILSAQGAKFYSYQVSSGHLDHELEALRIQLEQQNMSHGISDIMQIFRLSLARSLSPQLIEDIMPLLDAYISLLKILERDFKTNIPRMLKISEEIRGTHKVSPKDFAELKELNKSLASEWRELPARGDANIAILQP